MPDLPWTWREPHRNVEIPFPQAIEEWAQAAVPVLEDVARTYSAYISYKELAARLFDATGIHTRMLVQNLSARLLNRVIHLCLKRHLPALSAMVFHATEGMIGAGFGEVLRAAGKDAQGLSWNGNGPRGLSVWPPTRRTASARRCQATADSQIPGPGEPGEEGNPATKTPCAPYAGFSLPAMGVCDDCA